MSDEINVTGNCYCGNIKVIARVKKSEIRACHCTDCQKFSGAPLRAIAVAPFDKISIEGTPKEYVKIGDSGNKRIQAFCSECGTQLFATDVEKKFFNIRTGLLDQRNDLIPNQHVFTTSSMTWFKKQFFSNI